MSISDRRYHRCFPPLTFWRASLELRKYSLSCWLPKTSQDLLFVLADKWQQMEPSMCPVSSKRLHPQRKGCALQHCAGCSPVIHVTVTIGKRGFGKALDAEGKCHPHFFYRRASFTHNFSSCCLRPASGLRCFASLDFSWPSVERSYYLENLYCH